MGALTETSIADRVVAAIEARDADAFAALLAEQAVAHHPLSPEPLRGREAIRDAEQELFEQYSDVRVDARSVLADGNGVALQIVLRATHSSGRRIELPAVWWYELDDDGLIAEARDYFDTALLTAQLDE